MGWLQLHLTCQTAKPTGTLSRSLYVCLCAFATAPFAGPLLNVSPVPHGYGYDLPLVSHTSTTCLRMEKTQDGPPQKKHIPWTCRYGFWFKAIQYAWLPTRPAGQRIPQCNSTANPAGLHRSAGGLHVWCGFAFVGERGGRRWWCGSDGNNVRRAERGQTSLVKLLVWGSARNLAKFPSGPIFFFFKSLNLPSFV